MEILAEELFTAMGGSDWSATRSYVYGSDRGRVGTLATAVARAAEVPWASSYTTTVSVICETGKMAPTC